MDKLEELKELIKQAKDAYYSSGKTIMSDAEYDRLIAKAERLGYIETVGAEPVSELPKIKHEHPMLSLGKVHTVEEVNDFIGDKEVVAMYKADGLSISATYIDGVLTRLETRGNGEVGNDIMIHAKSFMNLPLVIDKSGKYVIDGECVILRKDFEAINTKIPDEDDKYKNPRNLAAGSLNLQDQKISATRKLRFYAWDVIEGGGNFLDVNLIEAKRLGFESVFYFCCRNMTEDKLDYIRGLSEMEGIPIDGVVIKYNDIEYGKSLGATIHHPNLAVAYKFEDESFPSTLRDCIFQVGKTGQLTPVLIFDPIEIDGSAVEKCSAHNISILKELNPRIGCTCYVYKANGIIPQVDCCDDDGDEEIVVPSVCPVCGSPTIIRNDNDSEVLYCTNPHCAGRSLGKFKHFVSRKGMDITGLSEETLRKFINLGWIERFMDIYDLPQHYNEMINLDGFGKTSVDKLLKSIEASRHNVQLQKFITALSIPGVSEGQSKAICKKYSTWQEFLDARNRPGSYMSIDGIGDVIDSSIRNWFKEEDNLADASNVAAVLQFEDAMNEPEGDFPLSGMTFVITGKLNHFDNRNQLVDVIEKAGGKVSGSISAKTTYLINNDTTSTSGKNKKAHELGTKIISEDDLLAMIKK